MSKRTYTESDIETMNPKDFRDIVRGGGWTDVNPNACRGYGPANLAIVPKDVAFEFLLFCNRNPRPCPILDITDPGDPHPKLVAPDADLRTDLPKYCIFKDGEIIDEPTEISKYWRDDMVAFLLGCNIGFLWTLKAANVRFRSLGVYTTNIPLVPAGPFHGHMAVTCRAFERTHDAVRAVQISSRHIAFHGPPVHIGDPNMIGIKHLGQPDAFAPPWPTPPPKPNEIVMYWGCGITPQRVALEARLPFMITHCPAHMFITDKLAEEIAIL